MTVHHYFKTRRSVNTETSKNFECIFKCSRENHQPHDDKLALMSTTPGKEYQELPLLQRISSLELPASGTANEQQLRLEPRRMLHRV